MRILFIVIGNSRRSNYLNGYNLRYGGGGGSGTDSSSILVAEYLSKFGNEVVICTDALEKNLEEEYSKKNKYELGDKYYGVQYTNINLDGVENKTFDILVSMLWFEDYDKLPIKVTKSIIYWSHMQWIYGVDSIVNYALKNDLSIRIVHISKWERDMNSEIVNHIKNKYIDLDIDSTLIPNPVMDDIINEVLATKPIRNKHKFVFHASWARGGNVALEAVRQLDYPNKEFHSFDYLMSIHPHQDSFFHLHNGVDKKTLFTHLAESEYFVYPLYTPYQDVHKDTFSCVVAEAIAFGVIPVTYRLGALPEYFEDYCIWIDPPDGISLEDMQKEPLSKDIDGHFKNNVPKLVEKIVYLENNPHIKENIRKSGGDYIMSKFNINMIGKKWLNFIEDIV
jgi:glycosyltransferase involved in cell wall biosynthesis